MATVEMRLDITVYCNEHPGEELVGQCFGDRIYVEPCKKCLEEAQGGDA